MTIPSISAQDRLAEQGRQWQRKPVLRAIYHDLYRRMASLCVPGLTLEVGGGSGGFKSFAPDVISSDIVIEPWLDVVADAQSLPFSDGSFSNIVMFDVLHHIEFPRLFFSEAQRTLRVGGRIVMVEPAITPVSWPFYHFIHEEPVRTTADPLAIGHPDPGRHAFDANQAIPSLIVGRRRKAFNEAFPNLSIVGEEWLSLFAYPLSGGFKAWSLLPARWVTPMIKLENRLAPVLGKLLGFRLLFTVEKRA